MALPLATHHHWLCVTTKRATSFNARSLGLELERPRDAELLAPHALVVHSPGGLSPVSVLRSGAMAALGQIIATRSGIDSVRASCAYRELRVSVKMRK